MQKQSDAMNELPITECLEDLVAAVGRSTPVVLKAPPGAGKTTGVPPALLRSGVVGDGKMLLIQPRRLAARAAATRLANVTGTSLGDQVGYHVRFDKRFGRQTKLIAMTTGILLRQLQSDPLLEDVSCVLLDEFHERSLDVDLALGMLHRIRTTLRPELQLVVMSATLDPKPIVDFLGDGESLVSEGRAFPVQVHHCEADSRETVDHQVISVLPRVLEETSGHVLVFLPGVGEIRQTQDAIRSTAWGANLATFPLYGELAAKEQDAVLSKSAERKIILATNVAETSITIPGVTGVIDTGLVRMMRFDARVGLPKLQLEPISQASADQRAGRAGRTEPGICYRLWSSAMHRSRRSSDAPEIERCDLSDAILMLFAWGERDVFDFPWLSPPPRESVDNAMQLLRRLSAIDAQGSITAMGRQMLRLPIHPRLGRFMIEASRLGIAEDASLAAAILTERDPVRDLESVSRQSVHGCDVTEKVERLKSALSGSTSASRRSFAVKNAKRVADQIRQSTPEMDLSSSELLPVDVKTGDVKTGERLPRALLSAYPDRVARRRSDDDRCGVMVGGRGVRLSRRSRVRSGELFLCIDVDSKGTEATVHSASVIDESWLDPNLVREVDEPFFHAKSKSVVARRRKYFEDLLLRETPIPCTPSGEIAALLFQHAKQESSASFLSKHKQTAEWIERVRFLTRHMPELNLASLDEKAIDAVLLELCQRCTSIDQLAAAPWLDHLRGRYDYSQTQQLEQYAPSRMTVPSGNSIAIRYSEGKSPVMEVRIQELFGWSQTPCVAGTVPLQLHLLGPNYRAQQVTDDLASFWSETYVHVRKELRRRYPKHHWPEDPSTATATRNGLKPRGTS